MTDLLIYIYYFNGINIYYFGFSLLALNGDELTLLGTYLTTGLLLNSIT